MGFTYLGPIDGHDLPRLCDMLEGKELHGPVVVHVYTVKGKGYPFAEQNPGKFHGISPFDPATGLLKKPGGESFSSQFGKTLTDCAAQDARVCAITAAMADGTGLAPFAKEFPSRFFDVAIAEGHGVAMAAGLARQGMIPAFAVYSTFLQRGYDQLFTMCPCKVSMWCWEWTGPVWWEPMGRPTTAALTRCFFQPFRALLSSAPQALPSCGQ